MRRARVWWLGLAAAAAAAGCAHGGPPAARPSDAEGMVRYTVGRLTFDAPAGWEASGDERRLQLASPGGDARLEAQVGERAFRSDADCLAQAEEALARGAAQLSGVRRHATTVAGRRALVQEADQGAWHGWAWAACDAGEQYRIFLTGRAPVGPEALRVVKVLPQTAVLLGRPGA